MRVSTSTDMCMNVLYTQTNYYNSKDAIDAIAWAGFHAIDINLHQFKDELAEGDWRAWAQRCKEYALSKGLPITQAHAHMYGSFEFYEYTQEQIDYHAELVRRDIEAAAILGTPWVVVHPDSYLDETWYSWKKSMDKNVERFKEYGEVAAKHGVGIAIENMIDKRSLRRFGACTEDLLELLDRLDNKDIFGICWDTGHANMHQINQVKALHDIGDRLKAVHINDNDGVYDKHMLPFQGSINWKSIVETLKDIDYKGDFTYEIHAFTRGFDAEFHHQALKFARELGEHLVTL